jgi:hypothetical protein
VLFDFNIAEVFVKFPCDAFETNVAETTCAVENSCFVCRFFEDKSLRVTDTNAKLSVEVFEASFAFIDL